MYPSANRNRGTCDNHKLIRREEVEERSRYVLRAEAGLIPHYRGRHSTYTFGIIEAFKVKILRCPFSEFYYLGTLVHPSSYALFGYFFSDMTPYPNREMPNETRSFMLKLASYFNAPAVNSDDPMVRDVGWVTLNSTQSGKSGNIKSNEFAAFFKARSPGYVHGHGLLVLISLTLKNLLRAVIVSARR